MNNFYWLPLRKNVALSCLVLLSLILLHQTQHTAGCMRANPNADAQQPIHAVAAKTTTTTTAATRPSTTTTTTASTTTPQPSDAGVVESGGKVYRFQTEQQLQALYEKYTAESTAQQGVLTGDDVSNDTATDDGTSHHLPCTLDEKRLTRCVNGGVCFAVIILEQRHIACHCPAGYTGKRCEERVMIGVMSLDTRDIEEDDGGARVIFIVVGVSVGVVVLSAVAIGLVVYCRRRHYQDMSKGGSKQLIN